MAIYVIGDIHGEIGALRRLIDRVAPTPADIIIQLGDCIDRGPDSFAVVEYWINFDRCQRCVLGGNHEELFFEYLTEGLGDYAEYGGMATVESYRRHGWACEEKIASSIPDSHLQFFLQAYPWTRPVLVTAEYVFTHAGYNFGVDRNHQDGHLLRWGQVQAIPATGPTVIRGHTPYRQVRFGRQLIEVDTGCGVGGNLSCLKLPRGPVTSEQP